MAEHVNTGGNVSFVYPKGYKPERDEEWERKFDEAMARGRERIKRKRKRNRIITFLIIILLIISASLYFWLK